MSEQERNTVVYVTAGAQAGQKMSIDIPHGLIPPPFIELHRPLALVGTVVFFHAERHRLPVPK